VEVPRRYDSQRYGMRINYYFIYDYCYYYDVWDGVGFQETQPPKLVYSMKKLEYDSHNAVIILM